MDTHLIFSMIFIAIGAVLLACAMCVTRKLLKILQGKETTNKIRWRLLSYFMALFSVGYIASIFAIYAGYADIMVLLSGVIYLFGALFVYIVVDTGFKTIQELQATSVSKKKLALANDDLMEARDIALRASEAKSKFIAQMSHEFRTPLNGIIGFTSILLGDKNLSPDYKRKIGLINQSGEHLLLLIDNTLEMSKLESGIVSTKIEEVCLNDKLQICYEYLKPLMDDAKVTMQLPTPDDAQVILIADKLRVKQILLNLLSNAIKYNCIGGSVTVSTQQVSPDRVRVDIRDTGIGLDEDQIKSVFEHFNRVGAENTSIEGSGIGLALVKDLLHSMDGSIHVESHKGVGSTFYFELPGKIMDASQASQQTIHAL